MKPISQPKKDGFCEDGESDEFAEGLDENMLNELSDCKQNHGDSNASIEDIEAALRYLRVLNQHFEA